MSGAARATTQLTVPTGVAMAYGSAAGSVAASFTAPANAAAGQTYTAKACTDSAMTANCVTNASYTSGANLTGLNFTQGSAGIAYYVTVAANALAGLLRLARSPARSRTSTRAS